MIEMFSLFIDIIFHLDAYVGSIISRFGLVSYLIFFGVIFLETGVVVTPFLPGDSLIFLLGTFASQGYMSLAVLLMLLIAAAILGDSMNYAIGRHSGKRLSNSRWVRKEYLEKTAAFYEKHGGKTIIFARFIPIVRTFAPFVAGIGKMDYKRFLMFNIIGGVCWVTLFLLAGYFFGSITWVQHNLTLITFIIIFTSFIPPGIEFAKHHFKKHAP